MNADLFAAVVERANAKLQRLMILVEGNQAAETLILELAADLRSPWQLSEDANVCKSA